MYKNILKLALVLTIGSIQALPTLHRVDTSFMGQPLHEVTITDHNYRTVYAAYPKEALKTIEKNALCSAAIASLSTTGIFGGTMMVIGHAVANTYAKTLFYLQKLASINRSQSSNAPSILTPKILGYSLVTALSAYIAHEAWREYNKSNNVFLRLLYAYNPQKSILLSDFPIDYFPYDSQEIARINNENPNLIWFCLSQERLENNAAMLPHAPITTSLARPVAPVVVEHPECSVCLENILPNQDHQILRCNHPFHTDCINGWFALNNTCPYCRAAID